MPTLFSRIIGVLIVVLAAFILLWILGLLIAIPATIVQIVWVIVALYCVGILFGWIAGPGLPF